MTWGSFSRTKEHVAGVFLLAMTLSHIVLVPGLLPFLRSGYPNFASFYTAGDMVRRGQTTSLYNLSAQYQLQKQLSMLFLLISLMLSFSERLRIFFLICHSCILI